MALLLRKLKAIPGPIILIFYSLDLNSIVDSIKKLLLQKKIHNEDYKKYSCFYDIYFVRK